MKRRTERAQARRDAAAIGRVKTLGTFGERHRPGAHAQSPRSCREKFCNYVEGHDEEDNHEAEEAHPSRAKGVESLADYTIDTLESSFQKQQVMAHFSLL